MSDYIKDEPQNPYLVEEEGSIGEVNDFHKEQFNTIKQQVSIINHQSTTINLQTGSINENTHTISLQTGSINENTHTINLQTGSINENTHTIDFQTGIINQQASVINQQNNVINQQALHLSIITENMTDALLIINADGSYSYLNKHAYELIFQSENFLNHDDSLENTNYYDEDSKILTKEDLPSSRILRGEVIENVILKNIRPDKTTYLNFNGNPIYSNGELVYAILCIRDITEKYNYEQELKENQERLIKSEKEKNEILEASMKLKDEFLYLITHEFRTPMAVVNSALQAIELMCKGEVTERVGKHLATIKQNTNRQLRLVNNLLDITKINSGYIKLNKSYFEIVYVTKAIINSVELYANQKKVNLYFTSNIAKKTVCLDEEKFERIMLNLLSNALKFTQQGKSINVMLSVKKHKNKNFICVSVKDEGIGIPKDRHQIIFERFGQADTSLSRQAEGTGLGLHLVKLLVNALEGEIILESEESEGSIFTVLLPVANKSITLDEVVTCSTGYNQFFSGDSRIVQTASIEFSDIYLDRR